MERRFTPNRTVKIEKREDGSATITGYGAVYYDSSDSGTEYELWKDVRERVMPGTFDRAIKEKQDVRGLFNHDSNTILGRTSAGTMRLSSDKVGLRYEIDAPDTVAARDIVELIGRGDISGSSFAFRVTREEWEERDGVEIRKLLDVDLFDAGPVTYPAYESTTTGVRSSEDASEARESYKLWREHVAGELQKIQQRGNLDYCTALLATVE